MFQSSNFVFLVDRKNGHVKFLNGWRCFEEFFEVPSYHPGKFSDEHLPAQVDLRKFMTTVEDQAQSGSCVANAIVGAYEYFLNRIGRRLDFSRLFVYYNARLLQGGTIRDNGCSVESALRSVQKQGICYESTWDYKVMSNGKVKNVNIQPSADAYQEALALRRNPEFCWAKPEKVEMNLYHMKHCLAEGYPFIFGLKLFDSFDGATRTGGRVPMPTYNQRTRKQHGNHGMLCVGYIDKSKMFIVRNSWGSEWGDRGYCYIPYDYLTNPDLCYSCWKINGSQTVDLKHGVWFDEHQELQKIDEIQIQVEEEPVNCYLTLVESIAVICLCGAAVDGVSSEEYQLLHDLYFTYGIDTALLTEKIIEISSTGGFEDLYNAAVLNVLAEDFAEQTFRMSIEFAVADKHFTEEEITYWVKLADDLDLTDDQKFCLFTELLTHQSFSEQSLPTPLLNLPIIPPAPPDYAAIPLSGTVQVKVISARNLVQADYFGKSDPYVVLSLGNQTFTTKVIPCDLNPVWNEVFKFAWDPNLSAELMLRVLDKDFVVDDEIGGITLDLSTLGLSNGEPLALELPLENIVHGTIQLEFTLL